MQDQGPAELLNRKDGALTFNSTFRDWAPGHRWVQTGSYSIWGGLPGWVIWTQNLQDFGVRGKNGVQAGTWCSRWRKARGQRLGVRELAVCWGWSLEQKMEEQRERSRERPAGAGQGKALQIRVGSWDSHPESSREPAGSGFKQIWDVTCFAF